MDNHAVTPQNLLVGARYPFENWDYERKLEAAMVSVRQVKAARALLAWSQGALAEASGLSESIVARLEAQDGEIDGRADGGAKLLMALKSAGVVFLAENGEGQGVRLHRPLGSLPSSIPVEDLNAENDE